MVARDHGDWFKHGAREKNICYEKRFSNKYFLSFCILQLDDSRYCEIPLVWFHIKDGAYFC